MALKVLNHDYSNYFLKPYWVSTTDGIAFGMMAFETNRNKYFRVMRVAGTSKYFQRRIAPKREPDIDDAAQKWRQDYVFISH